MGLAGFVKWPNPSESGVAEDGTIKNPAYVYFKFAPFDRSLLLGQATAISGSEQIRPHGDVRNFQTGVRAFNRNLVSDVAIESAMLPVIAAEKSFSERVSPLKNDEWATNSDAQAADTQAAINYLQSKSVLRNTSRTKTNSIGFLMPNFPIRSECSSASPTLTAFCGGRHPGDDGDAITRSGRSDVYSGCIHLA